MLVWRELGPGTEARETGGVIEKCITPMKKKNGRMLQTAIITLHPGGCWGTSKPGGGLDDGRDGNFLTGAAG